MIRKWEKYKKIILLIAAFLLSVFSGYSQTENEIKDTSNGESMPFSFQEKNTSKDSILLRHLPDSVLKEMQTDDNFWYANYVFKKRKQDTNNQTSILETTWFQTLLWLIIISSFIAFVMWYLTNNQIGIFRRSIKSINEIEEPDTGTDNIFAINYQQEIENAIQKGDYRLAIRLMFLRMLKHLSEKNIIQYRQERTNLEYLLQVNNTAYYNDFFRLIRNYEYSWYGHFDVNTEKFAVIKNDFEKFDQKL